MNVVVAGDFQGKAVVFIDTKKGIGIATSLLARKNWIPLTRETVAKYDAPSLKGVTGVRPYTNEKSNYCIKKSVKEAFENLFSGSFFSSTYTFIICRDRQYPTMIDCCT